MLPSTTARTRRGPRLRPGVTSALALLAVLALASGCADARSAPRADPTPSATVAPSPTVPAHPTTCGMSFELRAGESYAEALLRVDRVAGGLELVRVFYPGLPQAWTGKLDAAGDRPQAVSFKVPPTEILAGRHDDYLRAWFAGAPRDVVTYWTYYHEPEDQVAGGAFTAAAYRAAWTRVAGLAAEADNPRLRATLILMDYTLLPASGRTWTDYYPGPDVVDVLGWDVYDRAASGRYASPQVLFGPLVSASQTAGKPFAVAELGAPRLRGDGGAGRATWITRSTRYLSERGAEFVAYFDHDWRDHGGPDYRLADAPSRKAWRTFCRH